MLSEMGEVTVSLNTHPTNVSPCRCAGEGDWAVCAAQAGWQLSVLPGTLLSEGPPQGSDLGYLLSGVLWAQSCG